MVVLWLSLIALVLSVSANISFGYLIYKLKNIIRMAKTAYGMMGKQSGIIRQAKAIEKGITQNVFQMEAPEIKVLLSLLPEDYKDRLDEIDPEVWLYLLEKYKPLIQQLLPRLMGQKEERRTGYHIE